MRCPYCNTTIPLDCDICEVCWNNLPIGEREDLVVYDEEYEDDDFGEEFEKD